MWCCHVITGSAAAAVTYRVEVRQHGGCVRLVVLVVEYWPAAIKACERAWTLRPPLPASRHRSMFKLPLSLPWRCVRTRCSCFCSYMWAWKRVWLVFALCSVSPANSRDCFISFNVLPPISNCQRRASQFQFVINTKSSTDRKAHVSSQHVFVYACVNKVSTMWKQQKDKRRTNVTFLFSKNHSITPVKVPVSRPKQRKWKTVQSPARWTWPPLNECSSSRQI